MLEALRVTREFAAVLLGAYGIAVTGPFAQEQAIPQLTHNQIADYYVELAFGSEFSFVGSQVSDKKIFKRYENNIVNVLPLPQPSVPLADPISLVKKVVGDIGKHSGGIRLNTYDERTIPGFVAAAKNRPAYFDDTVAIYIGSPSELLAYIEKASTNNPVVRQAYEAWKALPADADAPLCMATMSPRVEGSQVIGIALVWVEYGPRLEECLYEEVMQSFGIANDFPASTPSMFNDDDVHNAPTPLDWALWRIHTDPRIRAGMKEEEVRPIVMQILDDQGF